MTWWAAGRVCSRNVSARSNGGSRGTNDPSRGAAGGGGRSVRASNACPLSSPRPVTGSYATPGTVRSSSDSSRRRAAGARDVVRVRGTPQVRVIRIGARSGPAVWPRQVDCRTTARGFRPPGVPTICKSARFEGRVGDLGIQPGPQPERGSRQGVPDHLPADTGQSLFHTGVKIRQLLVVETQEVEDGGVQVGRVARLLDRIESQLVGRPDRLPALDAGPRQPHREPVR